MAEHYHALRAYLRRNLYETSGSVRMRHRIIEGTGTHYHICSTKGHGKAIQASGSWSVEIFSINIIVRTMSGTFKAIAVIAERYGTAEVDTALVQGNPMGALRSLDKVLRI